MAFEITITIRFEQPPVEEDFRALLEDEFDAIVLEYDEQEC